MKTNKTLQGSVSLPKSLVIRKGEIVQSEEFITFVTAQKRLQEQLDNNWKMLKELMEKKEVGTVKGSWGYVTLANKKSLVALKPLPPRFYKTVLDTSKIEAYKKIKGEYPKNIQRTDSKYLAKRILI
jgi:hypothetical protein